MFDDVFPLPTPFEAILIRIARSAEPPSTPERLEAVRRVVFELRFGLENFDPRMITAAERLHHALFGNGQPRPARLDATPEPGRGLELMLRDLETALERGRLVLHDGPLLRRARPEEELGSRRPEIELPAPPPRAPSRVAPSDLTSFEARLVDEIGQGISGVEVAFTVGSGTHRATTNAAGIAEVNDVPPSPASIDVAKLLELSKILDKRWAKFRPGKPPTGKHIDHVVFDGSPVGVSGLKAGIQHTVVLKPPLGQILVELFDKSGRVRHAERPYEIAGPVSFSGETDAKGRLLHEDVPAGDYELALTLEVDPGSGEKVVDTYKSPLVVLSALDSEPELRLIGALPRVVLARMRGMFFDLNKAFLLPLAQDSLKKIRDIYVENNPSQLLIVGHTDTSGEPDFNDELSLERADSTHAYLVDDVDAWLKFYEDSVPQKKRWGRPEDELMLAAVGIDVSSPDPVRDFQRSRGLEGDGVAGPKTRRQLIKEYMALDGASLNELDLSIEVTTHGCGENFPLDATGEALDPDPEDPERDQIDRRVELFFFDSEFGIQPPPPGKSSKQGSQEYLKWRRRAELLRDFGADFIQGLVVEWVNELDESLPGDLRLIAQQAGVEQQRRWVDGHIDEDFRRFAFTRILGSDPVTLTAESEELGKSLVLWREQVINDPDTPPVWEHVLEEMVGPGEPDGEVEPGAAIPPVSDAAIRPPDLAGDMFS